MNAVVLVQPAGMPLVTEEGKKPFIRYFFTLQVGDAQHMLCARYSVWHRRLARYATSSNRWPRDPFSMCKDYVFNVSNVRRRCDGLRRFIAGVLNQPDGGAVVGDARLHARLHISPGTAFHTALLRVAESRRRIAEASRAVEAAQRWALGSFSMAPSSEADGEQRIARTIFLGDGPEDSEKDEDVDFEDVFSLDWSRSPSQATESA
mmetsp:Transcript_21285/g.56995  ORF Transcript_21285/g.56995 Transcript_21285/m.56995 type:complete len:206 (+) Transcript_21285:54-671(+)